VPTAPSNDVTRKALGISVAEGSLHAVMLGASETYFGTFAVELGHDAERMAILATVPLCLGALSQLFAGSLTRLLGRKRLSVIGAFLQAACHFGFIWIALYGDTRLWSLLLAKSLFWISGSVMAPAWGDWIASLTSGVHRERYFARRSGIVHVCLLTAFTLSGLALYQTEGSELSTYAALFAVGAVARFASAAALVVQSDPNPPAPSPLSASRRILLAFREGRFRVVVYYGCLMCGASVAIPFFTPYMLEELGLDYGTFTALSAVSILTKAVAFPLLRRVSEALGLPRLLLLSGLGVALVPLLWTVARSFELLILVHVVSGAAWAGLEFASFQILMNEIRADLRSEFLALSNAFSGTLQVVGSIGGGLLLRGNTLGYSDVFLLSALLRALPLLLLLVLLPRLRLPKRLRGMPMRLFSVRPSAGAAQRPILPAQPGDEDEVHDYRNLRSSRLDRDR
jgi:MFS family permease